ncbi:unnamed protein product [Albugo candida]|uniref:BRCT domain-containing protein n=2 Tax=Albugo candida TaxID=65357 RepID=A0A024GRG9_9STRA|nr:unnamed protein product [Albugo candida]|eukprot:CCI49330.1 unnamed protein product [Albugo candida]
MYVLYHRESFYYPLLLKFVPQRITKSKTTLLDQSSMNALNEFITNTQLFNQFLKTHQKDLTQRLSYEIAGPTSLLSDKCFYMYAHLTQQLCELYEYFITEKLIPLLSQKETSSTKQTKLKSTFLIVCDFLQVVRIVYAQMFYQIDIIESASQREGEIASPSIDAYNNQEDLAVLTPPIIEIPSGQTPSLKEKRFAIDEISQESRKSFDAIMDIILALASSLDPISQSKAIEITESTKNYICRKVSERKESKYLIELEEQIQGLPCSLYGLKLLLEDKMVTHVHSIENGKVCLVQSQKVLYLLDNGLLIFASPKSMSKSTTGIQCNGASCLSSSQHCSVVDISLRLDVDDIFIENQPERVHSQSEITDELFALICHNQVIMISFSDIRQKQIWHRAIERVLTDNGNRTRNVKHDEIQTDHSDLALLLEEMPIDQIPLIRLASHDAEELTDLFWIKCDGIKAWVRSDWALGKIMFDGKTMLLFEVLGWKSYNHLLTWSCIVKSGESGCAPIMQIVENSLTGPQDWSLQLTLKMDANTYIIQLMTTRRNRTDFWFDQFAKAIARNEKIQINSERKRSQRIEPYSPTSSEKDKAITGTARSKLFTARNKDIIPSDSTKRPSKEIKHDVASKAKWMQSKKQKKTNAELNAAQEESLKGGTSGYLQACPKESTKVSQNILITDAPTKLDEHSSSPHETISALTSPSIRIVLTGLDPSAIIRNQIKSITDAHLEEDIEVATHLIVLTHKLKRTVKLMCGIAYCDHIYIAKWLLDSANSGHPIENENTEYCLTDREAEQKWKFNLFEIMYGRTKEQRQRLFHGSRFFVTNHKSLLPPFNDLQKMVQSAGGTIFCKGIAEPTDIVITTKAALTVPSILKRLRNAQKVYSPELILSGILQQRLGLDNHQLELPHN